MHNPPTLIDLSISPTYIARKKNVENHLNLNLIPIRKGKERKGKTRYNLLGDLFEVSSKYIPPIQPVGRGAYNMFGNPPPPPPLHICGEFTIKTQFDFEVRDSQKLEAVFLCSRKEEIG
ncbi:hypothetical protein LguiB_013466 [Lonicera macranthoides]